MDYSCLPLTRSDNTFLDSRRPLSQSIVTVPVELLTRRFWDKFTNCLLILLFPHFLQFLSIFSQISCKSKNVWDSLWLTCRQIRPCQWPGWRSKHSANWDCIRRQFYLLIRRQLQIMQPNEYLCPPINYYIHRYTMRVNDYSLYSFGKHATAVTPSKHLLSNGELFALFKQLFDSSGSRFWLDIIIYWKKEPTLSH